MFHGEHHRFSSSPWGTSGGTHRRVHAVREIVEAIREQVAVEVERQRRRLVSEHLLDDLHVRARGDRERGGGVSELVRVEAVGPGEPDGGVEDGASEVPDAQHATERGGEHEVVGVLPLDQRFEVGDEEARQRDGRRACVFGAPHTSRPFTSVTDSATTRRRRTRSMRFTRSAAASPQRRPV